MASAQTFTPECALTSTPFSSMTQLQIARPTTKCCFVRQGDVLHLLVFINEYSDVPFLRVPVDSLYHAAASFNEG